MTNPTFIKILSSRVGNHSRRSSFRRVHHAFLHWVFFLRKNGLTHHEGNQLGFCWFAATAREIAECMTGGATEENLRAATEMFSLLFKGGVVSRSRSKRGQGAPFAFRLNLAGPKSFWWQAACHRDMIDPDAPFVVWTESTEAAIFDRLHAIGQLKAA